MNSKFYLVSHGIGARIVQGKDNAKMVYEGGPWTSCSSGCETINQLMMQCDIPEWSCSSCNGVVSLKYGEPTRTQMVERKQCFTCNFWTSRMKLHQTSENSAIVCGCAYMVHPMEDRTKGMFLGFGGRLQRFRFHDGRTLDSNNVWFQGEIPDIFREEMSDNAEIVPFKKEGI